MKNEIQQNDIQIDKCSIEIFNNDRDEICMTKLQNMFSDFGYNIKLITPHIINIIFGASDDSLSTIAFINLMIKNKDIGLLECDDGVDLLFPCDNKTVYFMNLKIRT